MGVQLHTLHNRFHRPCSVILKSEFFKDSTFIHFQTIWLLPELANALKGQLTKELRISNLLNQTPLILLVICKVSYLKDAL